MTNLNELASRVEALDGPCRKTDGDIWEELGLAPTEAECGGPFGFERGRYCDMGAWRAPEFNQPAPDRVRAAPAYTASLDAAKTLVPEGWEWTVTSAGYAECRHPTHGRKDKHGFAETPAPALCAAALRARSTMENNP